MRTGSKRAVEMPTLALAAAIHGGWLALTWWQAALPVWAVIAGGGWLVAWHGSSSTRQSTAIRRGGAGSTP